VKSAFEKAMEKIKEVEDLTPEEKGELKDRENLRAVLATFYKGELGAEGIWQGLKGMRLSLLREAQQNMADSLRLGIMPEELQQRKEGILAIEALKEKQNMAAVESSLNIIGKVRREYVDLKERARAELRKAIEGNPQMRIKQVRGPDGRILQTTMSVEEAIHARTAEFAAEHEKQYEAMFSQVIARLKKELK
jgi:hypothetical protein